LGQSAGFFFGRGARFGSSFGGLDGTLGAGGGATLATAFDGVGFFSSLQPKANTEVAANRNNPEIRRMGMAYGR